MKRGTKVASWLVASIISIGTIMVGMAPMVLSTPWGTQHFTSWLNRNIAGSVSIQQLQLSWFSGQILSGLEVRDPEGTEILSVNRVDAKTSFFRLLSTCPYVCTTSVDGVQALIVQDSNGKTNFQRTFTSKTASKTSYKRSSSHDEELAINLPIRGEIQLTQANIELRSPKLPPVALRNVSAVIHSPSHEGPLSIKMNGLSSTSDLSGTFALTARLAGFNAAGKLELKSGVNGYVTVSQDANIYLKLDLNHLPAATLDYLIAMRFPDMEGTITQALGDNLDLNFEQTIDSNAMALNLHAHSPTLDASMDARWSDGAITLAQPGHVTLMVTPALVQTLNPSLQLLKTTQARLLLDRMTLSASGSGAPSVRLKLQVDDLQIDGGASLGPIALTGVQGVLEYLETSQTLLGTLEALLNYGGSSGALRAQGKFASKSKQFDADYMITATQLPSILLDRALQSNGWFSDIVGERFDSQFTYAASPRGAEITFDFESEGISAPRLSLIHRDGALVAKPEEIQWKMIPSFARRLIGSENPIPVQGEASGILLLKRLRLPTSDKHNAFLWPNVQIEAAVEIGSVALDTTYGVIRLAAAKGNITGSTLSNAQFQLHADLVSDLENPLAHATIGKAASVHLDGNIGASANGTELVLKQFHFTCNSDLMAVQAAGSVDQTGTLTLSEPLVGHYRLSPPLLLALGLTQGSSPLLSQPVSLDLRLDQLSLSLMDFWNQDLLLQLKAKADLIDLKKGPGETFANLEGVTLALLFDSKQREAGMTLFGTSSSQDKSDKTPFDLDVTVNGWHSDSKWDWADLNVQAHGNLTQFPVKLVSTLTGQPDLVTLLGSTIDLTVNMKRMAKGQSAHDPIQISLKAQGIHLDAAFTAGKMLTQDPDHPVNLRLELTPDKFNILKRTLSTLGWNGLDRWKLVEDSVITVKGEQLTIPFPEDKKSYDAITGKLTTMFEPLVIQNIDTGKALAWETLKAQVVSEKIKGDYHLTVDAHEVPGQNSGTFAADGVLKKAWSAEGWFKPQQMTGGAKVYAAHLALTPILQVIAPQANWAKPLPGLLGESIALDGKFVWNLNNGGLQAKIHGSQGRAELDGSWENGFLVLHQPLIVEAKLTQRLIDEVLVDIAPILSSTIPSDQPIRFVIDSQETRIPLSGDTLQQLKLSRARLELGKVLFRGEGQIAQVSALLRGEAALSKGSFPVTFTPLSFAVEDGVVTIRRVDALVADRYPIAMWGTVDLSRDKVNLVIGITAQALKEAYGITIADDRYVLQLPLRGTLANASIDKIRATARITSLVAQSQGGPNGLILGGVLDLIGGGDDHKVPPPESPLPWAEKDSTPVTQAESKTDETTPPKKISTRKKIQNKLQKGASKLLNILK